jgi:transcriptional regulator with XRE-family HTH domain
MEHFGFEVARIRKRLGLSQAELAKGMGVSQGTVSRWEAGKNIQDRTLYAVRWFAEQRASARESDAV